jgi:hypothetical protein
MLPKNRLQLYQLAITACLGARVLCGDRLTDEPGCPEKAIEKEVSESMQKLKRAQQRLKKSGKSSPWYCMAIVTRKDDVEPIAVIFVIQGKQSLDLNWLSVAPSHRNVGLEKLVLQAVLGRSTHVVRDDSQARRAIRTSERFIQESFLLDLGFEPMPNGPLNPQSSDPLLGFTMATQDLYTALGIKGPNPGILDELKHVTNLRLEDEALVMNFLFLGEHPMFE